MFTQAEAEHLARKICATLELNPDSLYVSMHDFDRFLYGGNFYNDMHLPMPRYRMIARALPFFLAFNQVCYGSEGTRGL